MDLMLADGQLPWQRQASKPDKLAEVVILTPLLSGITALPAGPAYKGQKRNCVGSASTPCINLGEAEASQKVASLLHQEKGNEGNL
eukprot:1151810-Pelagomonas_calceolata.AAC.10